MPVTYATDLRDLKDFDYVPQVPLEALFKNMGYKQQKYDQGFQQTQRTADMLKVAAYGQDAVRRDEIIKEVNDQLKKFANQDFSDPGVLNQFNSYISEVASNPELVGMQSRANESDRLSAKIEKLTADGKTVISDHNKKAYLDLQDYFSGNQPYNPKKRVSGDVSVDFDFSSLDKEVLDSTKEIEEMKKLSGGQLETYKGKALAALYGNLHNAYQNNPAAKRELDNQFEAMSSGVDWSAKNTNDALRRSQNSTDNALVFKSLADKETEPTRKQYLLGQYQEAKDNSDYWKKSMSISDPNLSKRHAKEDWVRNKVLERAEANTTLALHDVKTKDIVLQNNAAQNALNLEEAKHQNDLELRAVDAGLSNIDASGNVTITAGPIPAKSTGNRKVTVGGQSMDYEFFVDRINNNDQSFVQNIPIDEKFKITKNGKTLKQTDRTIVTPMSNGDYMIAGSFASVGPDPVDASKTKIITNPNDYIVVTAEEIGNAFLGTNIGMTKKMKDQQLKTQLQNPVVQVQKNFPIVDTLIVKQVPPVRTDTTNLSGTVNPKL